MKKNLLQTIFKGLAVAMGIAVIVLTILGTLTLTTGMCLLGLGLSALAVGYLQIDTNSNEPQNG